jgi:hypothetical protein
MSSMNFFGQRSPSMILRLHAFIDLSWCRVLLVFDLLPESHARFEVFTSGCLFLQLIFGSFNRIESLIIQHETQIIKSW